MYVWSPGEGLPCHRCQCRYDALYSLLLKEFTFSAPSQKVPSMGSGKDAAGLLFSKPVENEDQKVQEEEEEDSSGGIKVARSLKSGSCLQILGIGM